MASNNQSTIYMLENKARGLERQIAVLLRQLNSVNEDIEVLSGNKPIEECESYISEQRQLLGDRLYPLVREIAPKRAGKITGVLLEGDLHEVTKLLSSPELLLEKVTEVNSMLEAHVVKPAP